MPRAESGWIKGVDEAEADGLEKLKPCWPALRRDAILTETKRFREILRGERMERASSVTKIRRGSLSDGARPKPGKREEGDGDQGKVRMAGECADKIHEDRIA